MSDAADRDAGSITLRGALARLADALLGLLRTRFELATLEYSEERERLSHQLMLLLAGVGCLLFALLFAGAAVVIYFWETYRLSAVIGVMVVFAIAGAVLLWRRAEIANTAATPFAASMEELEKDRAALSRTLNPPASQ
ncbi:MAG: phage holin family protein [Burkholderiales bacterium]|nr:phage holin family protein [Burkholderiales bacterium]